MIVPIGVVGCIAFFGLVSPPSPNSFIVVSTNRFFRLAKNAGLASALSIGWNRRDLPFRDILSPPRNEDDEDAMKRVFDNAFIFLLAFQTFIVPSAFANPQHPQVVHGSAAFSAPDPRTLN